jgi:hypothetical protein
MTKGEKNKTEEKRRDRRRHEPQRHKEHKDGTEEIEGEHRGRLLILLPSPSPETGPGGSGIAKFVWQRFFAA